MFRSFWQCLVRAAQLIPHSPACLCGIIGGKIARTIFLFRDRRGRAGNLCQPCGAGANQSIEEIHQTPGSWVKQADLPLVVLSFPAHSNLWSKDFSGSLLRRKSKTNLWSNMSSKKPLISSVEPIHAGQFLFVRVETDTGIVDYGEAGIWGHIEAAAAVIRRFADYLVGKPAFDIEHWNVMHRYSYFQGLAINAGISAIDVALWDIKGKALGVPIYELIGGACRTKARVYGHIYGSTIDAVLEECDRKVAQGFTALGHINPFLDESKDNVYFKPHVKKIRDAVDNVTKIRERVRGEVDLQIELHRRLSPAEAVAFSNSIVAARPLFVEDPIRPENPEAMARVADRISLPVATGERFSTIYEFQEPFQRDAVEFARLDVALCGGINGAKKVAALAEAHHVQLVPHNPLSPLGRAACLQIAAAVPNFAIQEYTTVFESGVYTSTLRHLGSDLGDHVPVPKDGFVDNPGGPGLRVNLVGNAAQIHPPFTLPITVRPHKDGFVVTQ